MSTNTTLFKAILAGKIEEVKTLLNNAKDININYINRSSKLSFLDAACQTQNPDMIHLVLDYVQKINTSPYKYLSTFIYNKALGIALTDQDSNVVNILLNSHKCIYNPAQLFHFAAKVGSLDIIKVLTDYGLDYNASLPQPVYSLSDAIDEDALSFEQYATALYIACGKGDIAMVEYLLSLKNIDVNKSCPADLDQLHFISPLMIAVKQNHTEIVRLLLTNHTIEVNQPDQQGKTPLDIALENNNLIIRDMLLAKGANPSSKQLERQHSSLWGSSSSSSSSFFNTHSALKKPRDRLFQLDTRDLSLEQRFIAAIENDEFEDVKNHLDTDPTIIERCDELPLNIACAEGHYEIAQLLIHYGANVNKADRRGNTPLLDACKHGHLQLLKLLINHGAKMPAELVRPFMLMNKDNQHPFWSAWLAGHVEIVNYLMHLQQEAVVMNEPALVSSILLCPKEHRVAMLKVLQSHGINLNIVFPILRDHKHDDSSSYYVRNIFQLPEPRHTSILIEACHDGEPCLIEHLMSLKEMDVNLLDSIRHPLTAACYKGSVDIVDKLLTRDCGTAGRDALIIACERGHVDIVERLLASNLDVTTTSKITTSTPLIVACQRGYLGVVDRLIMQFGPNDNDYLGFSPLMMAILFERIDVINRLIDSGANVNQTDNTGRTALMHAIERNQPDVVKKLIKANADILIATNVGKTALEIAQNLPRREAIIDLLQKALAKREGIESPRASMG